MDNIWTVYGSMLSFDTPKEETMQDAAQFVQLTQTLCYDLARAEKATDGKKNNHRQSVSAGKTNAIPTEPSGRLVSWCVLGRRSSSQPWGPHGDNFDRT